MMRGLGHFSEVTTAGKRPLRSRPIVTKRGSSTEWLSSNHLTAKRSRRATIAASKLTPWRLMFSTSLAGSRPYSITRRRVASDAYPAITCCCPQLINLVSDIGANIVQGDSFHADA